MKVGDYIRFENGVIGKISDIVKPPRVGKLISIEDSFIYYKEKEIRKSSPNIIDLIEIGDYVNGELIMDISSDSNINNEKLLYYFIPSAYGEDCFRDKDIKSIVTKEQFERMAYKLC